MKTETKLFSRDWNERLKWTQDGKWIQPNPGNCSQVAEMCAAQTLHDRTTEEEEIVRDILEYIGTQRPMLDQLYNVLDFYEIDDPMKLDLLWLDVFSQLPVFETDYMTKYGVYLGEDDNGNHIIRYPFDHDDREEFIETLEKIL